MTGAMELQLDDGPRSSLSIGPGFERCSGISPKFARRFAEGIEKLAGNTLGDRGRRLEDSPQEYRRLPNWREGGFGQLYLTYAPLQCPLL
ncbi:hypothetical protein B296_00012875, partial [Ensete ventricosum]